MNEMTEIIANNIKKYRLLNGMTQQELADLLQLDSQYYSMLETCRNGRAFSLEKIIMAASIFDCDINQLITIKDKLVENSRFDEEKNDIIEKIEGLNHNQVMILKTFIEKIIPYIN